MKKNEQTVDASVQVDDSERIRQFLEQVLLQMKLNCAVTASKENDAILLSVSGDDANCIIGYRGETLDALQYLCSLLLNGKGEGFRRVIIDTEGYREKREKTLQRLATNLEQKVKRTGKAVELEPMNPYERRIIHTALQNSKYVTTDSEGQGITRHVVVAPKEQNNILNTLNAPRKTLNFVYRSDKKR